MERIAVERLRVGLWVSMENVPGTGFLLRSEAQIATFAQVGVSHVWHEPERSEAAPLPEPAMAKAVIEPAPAPQPVTSFDPVEPPVDTPVETSGAPASVADPAPGGGIEIVAAVEPDRFDGEDLARGDRVSGFDDEPATAPPTDALDAQRQSLDRCERRFSAVSKAFRNVLQNVRAQP